MKKIITVVLILASFSSQAQTDSTKVKGLLLMVRMIEFLTPQLIDPSNDSLYQVYQDLRPKFRILVPPTGNTLVIIDSIPTVELANLYNYALATSDGMKYGSQMTTAISSARLSNTYLERLCAAVELYYSDRLATLRIGGRKLLRGK